MGAVNEHKRLQKLGLRPREFDLETWEAFEYAMSKDD